MNIVALTTFNNEGLFTYGQRLIDSWAKNVDPKIKLLVYAEDCEPTVPEGANIQILNADALPEKNAFIERWKNDPKATGTPPPEIKRRRPRDWHKEFKWDAIRFSHKVYAVFDAYENEPADWIVWVDGDTYVHSTWSYENFAKLLPKESWITYVGRGAGSQTWPECGFYGLNKNDKQCVNFIKEFKDYYNNAETGIFTLEEWHDSYVFGHILMKHKNYNPRALDYSASIYVKTAKTGGGGHPLINTELGRYVDHMKGDRKYTGHSKKKDLMTERSEAYWNEI